MRSEKSTQTITSSPSLYYIYKLQSSLLVPSTAYSIYFEHLLSSKIMDFSVIKGVARIGLTMKWVKLKTILKLS